MPRSDSETGRPRPGGSARDSGNNNNSRAASQEEEDRRHVHKPFGMAKPAVTAPYGEANHGVNTAPHVHAGTDYGTPAGTDLFSMVKSKVKYAGSWSASGYRQTGNLITLEALEDRGTIKRGDYYGYGHAKTVRSGLTAETEIPAGYKIGTSGGDDIIASSGAHTHMWMQRPGTEPRGDGSRSIVDVVDYAYGGSAESNDNGGGGTSPDANNGSGYSAEQISKSAAYSSILSIPGGLNSLESQMLRGQRSLMNDQPLLPFIEQICGASLRSFMSMPNGKFYAFYPDYFGGFNRQPYWDIADVEIISGRIDLSDDTLATHVFVVGDTNAAYGGPAAGYGNIDLIDKIQTVGVINIFNAFATGFLNGRTAQDKVLGEKEAGGKRSGRDEPKKSKKDNSGNYLPTADEAKPDELTQEGAINFLKKYGARPVMEPVPAIRSPIYETYLAFQRFCMLWASQFRTTFEFTFMPEIYPGGIVAFPEHGLQCYVEEVVHAGSYESGFTTSAVLSSPAALKSADGNPDQEWIHSGMVRAFVNNPDNFSKDKVLPKGKPTKKKPKPKGKS